MDFLFFLFQGSDRRGGEGKEFKSGVNQNGEQNGLNSFSSRNEGC